MEIRIGGEEAEFFSVKLLGRSHPRCSDYWDGNWLQASVQIAAGGFRGIVGGDIRADEILNFYEELLILFRDLNGQALFQTMERWLEMRVIGDGRGHLRFECFLQDKPGIGNTLRFALKLDQTFLPPVLHQLGKAVREYPMIGKP